MLDVLAMMIIRSMSLRPVCGSSMVKMGAAEGTVQIDVCQTCGGKFLDDGELQKIRKYKNDNQKINGIIGDLVEIAYANKYGETNKNPGRVFFEKLEMIPYTISLVGP